MKKNNQNYVSINWTSIVSSMLILLFIATIGCSTSDDPSGGDDPIIDTDPNTDNNSSASLMSDVPKVSNAVYQCENNCGTGIHQYFTTSGSANTIVSAYESSLKSAGWAIQNIGGDAFGRGGGLTATKGPKYLEYNVGGDPNGTMNIDLEVWPTEPSNKNCYNCKVTNTGGDNAGSDGNKNEDEEGGSSGGGDEGSTDLMADLPTVSSFQYQCENNCGDGLHRYYTTTGDALTIAQNYQKLLQDKGWTIEDQAGGVSNGAGLEASKSNKYLDFNVGGQSSSLMNVDISVWPSEPSNKNCQNCEVDGSGNDAGKPGETDGSGSSGDLFEDVPDVYSLDPVYVDKCSKGTHKYYRTNSSPTAVLPDFRSVLETNGWKVENYNVDQAGFGGGFIATKGSKYLVVNMGGWGTMHIDVCVWPSAPNDTSCGQQGWQNCN